MQILLYPFFFCPSADSSELVIVGDTQYKPVNEVIAAIKSTVSASVNVHATSSARGRLAGIVQDEGARLVVALGREALDEALLLPSSVAVVYGLVLVPPAVNRANLTGVYMSTPASEYISMARKYLPALRKISIVGSREKLRVLDGSGLSQVAAYQVSTSSELISMVNRLDEFQALVLLPDASLLTATAMDQVYLYSYRKNIPLLGISEGNVKLGALYALVFDPAKMGDQIGRMAEAVMNGTSAGALAQEPPRAYNLYINLTTARKMGITVPDEMVRRARRVY
jgi:hypothetical protein